MCVKGRAWSVVTGEQIAHCRWGTLIVEFCFFSNLGMRGLALYCMAEGRDGVCGGWGVDRVRLAVKFVTMELC